MQRIVTYPKFLLRVSITFLAVLFGLNFIFPLPIEGARQVSPVVLDKNGNWMTGFTVEDGIWRIPADLRKIDPRYIERLIAIEDQRYWNHPGVDVGAIFRAIASWKQAGKPVSGASTITMQLVRQIEPRERTLSSKMIESLRALQYELYFSKDEILELYLTHISYGGNLDGVNAATFAYFGKSAEDLSDEEIALLIAIPQAPEARRPDLWPNTAKRGRDKILTKLQNEGILSSRETKEASAVPVTVDKKPIPETAWISAAALKQKNTVVTSTIDPYLQGDIEAILSDFLDEEPDFVNAAMIIVENKTMAVRAHVASGGRDRVGGWLDMTRRWRSPGSTLKPFIYGLAMDDGVLSSASWIQDAPTRFGGYQPENFNRRYYGQVRIHEALRHSLNVPAVAVLDKVGGNRFENDLIASGIDVVRLGGDSEEAGLALALGGAGVTVNHLAIAYAALANDGKAKPLRWLETDPVADPKTFLSKETATDITEILRLAPTPEGRVPGWLTEDAPMIAYKTGTSYGFRDAWAAGYNDEWTIVVWVGRPDGAPRNGQTGRIAAAPVLFDAFSSLPRQEDDRQFRKDSVAPGGLTQVKDYTASGPQILFPPHEAELLTSKFGSDARGFTLSARADRDEVDFYVDGRPVPREENGIIWRPETPGFYKVVAVDHQGREAVSRVSVMPFEQFKDPRF